ncbi:MAG: trigger factor [Verrucomicrobiota bacterium]
MNVTVEDLAPCKKLLRVEVEAKVVDDNFESVTREFQRFAQLPGFRPGKAPRAMVVQTYSARIEEEVKRKLLPDAFRKAVDEHKLRIVGYPDIEEIQFAKGQALQFAATVETEPDFELPEYKGLPVKREAASVTDADVERAINVLRDQRAAYNDVEREVREDDYVVVNYTGTCDGKPITDTAPTARGLTQQKNFWMHVQAEHFIPGFTPQLVGAKKGDQRTVTVEFPKDFVTPQLVGKQGVYQVELVQVKERSVPEVNDEFAKSFGAENLEKLREGVRTDLQHELDFKQRRSIHNQLIGELLRRVQCELPESLVNSETRNTIYNIVQENQQRGLTKEAIDSQKDQIYAFASQSAKDRVKAMFLMRRIAEKESVKVDQQEVAHRVMAMAQQYQMPPDKMIEELKKRDGFGEIHEQIMTSKVLDLLQLHASVEEVPAGSLTPAS